MTASRPSTLPDLLQHLLSADPARPLVTFYDDASGERVELSVKSFENWVAKTANLLQGELGADPGAHVALLLPTHWQSAVWVFAAAACGATVGPHDAPPAGADVVVCDPDSLERALAADAPEVVALSLLPMNQPFGDLPGHVTDYAASVLAQGDVFAPLATPEADTPFVVAEDAASTQAELLRQAEASAGAHGLARGGRLLTDANPASTTGLTGGVLAALVAEGSVVLNRNPDPGAVDGRVAQEQVTAQWWCGG